MSLRYIIVAAAAGAEVAGEVPSVCAEKVSRHRRRASHLMRGGGGGVSERVIVRRGLE